MKQERRWINGLWLLMCSAVPGCGQMCQGYMKRGLSIMALFWGGIWVSDLLYFANLPYLMIPVWLYAFFDSYDLRARLREGFPREDDFLVDLPAVDGGKLRTLLRARYRLVGWGLVVLGIYLLYEQAMEHLSRYVYHYLEHLVWLYDLLRYSLPRVAVSLGVIALGIWFLRGPKQGEEAPFQPFGAEPMEQEDEAPTETAAEAADVTQEDAAQEADYGER